MFSEEQINKIIGLKSPKGPKGELIDIFKDFAWVLYVGNTIDGKWDITKRFTFLAEHRLTFNIEDFENAETDEDVAEIFYDILTENILM